MRYKQLQAELPSHKSWKIQNFVVKQTSVFKNAISLHVSEHIIIIEIRAEGAKFFGSGDYGDYGGDYGDFGILEGTMVMGDYGDSESECNPEEGVLNFNTPDTGHTSGCQLELT